jgi:peptidoglycan/xylan/chitin deacetylase (PgdA/CDA1 family)
MTQVVNICFHGIGDPHRELEPGEAEYWVSADLYRAILDEIAGWPSVAISFDDGNDSDIGTGLPELRSRGLAATFFPLAGRLGEAGSLSAADVRELAGAGMRIGSHGMAHRSWRGMDDATRTAELVEARQRLAEAAGTPVTEAACPLGRYDRRVLSGLRQLGYLRVYTSDRRVAGAGSWLQPRFSVRRGDSPQSVRAAALQPPGLPRRARDGAVGVIKRIR